MEWGINFTPFASTCTKTSANIGDVITLSASGSGGIANYTAYFSQNGGSGSLSNASVSNLAENVQGTSKYTVVDGDSGKSITFSSYVVDSCASGAKISPTQTCSVTIASCNTPTCGFSIS